MNMDRPVTHTAKHKTRTFLSALLLGSSLAQLPNLAFAQDADTTTIPTDEVVATGVFIPNEKKITSEITSVLDEDTFSQIGAGDIASALTRVPATSIS